MQWFTSDHFLVALQKGAMDQDIYCFFPKKLVRILPKEDLEILSLKTREVRKFRYQRSETFRWNDIDKDWTKMIRKHLGAATQEYHWWNSPEFDEKDNKLFRIITRAD